ncbi:MAG TPA: endonuclease/exonuclease/phosphatase family protein [Thermoanaerobaculia bacterium]|jgi:endonuclease/exonuclease/phosphatase family metal-dependent hydrolase|nr:endonuclease/exonuclease/phosphatase family protein [Thermoanaerobaculia bacterium]
MARLRLMTYNVRSCSAGGGEGGCERVAEVVAALAPDVVALQELEAGQPGSGYHEQAQTIADLLGMGVHYQPAMRARHGGTFGNALLSRAPLRLVASGLLPHLQVGFVREPRGISWLAVAVDGREVQVLVTHLGLTRRERRAQVEALLGPAWLGAPRCRPPRLLCGDLNTRPGSYSHRRLAEVLVDAVLVAPPEGGRAATFPATRPLVRLDHVMVSPDLRVCRTDIPRGREVRRASDHLPVVVDLELPSAAA